MTEILSKLTNTHLDEVVTIHLKAFPGFFLSFLGPRFLKEFYNSFIEDSRGIGFVAQDPGGQILGVIVGPLEPHGYYKRLIKRRWWAFCIASVSAVVRKPASALRLFRALFYRGDAPSDKNRALLSSVCVHPKAQRLGIGKRLVDQWVNEASARGVSGCFLTTDANDNEAVNSFYQRTGWHLESTYLTPEGRRMNRYVYDF